MSNLVEIAAKNYIKNTHSNDKIRNAVAYLNSIGYMVEFFDDDNPLINLYELTEKALTTPAFTCFEGVKKVFIHKNLATDDKYYLLLHEIGHIVLNHTTMESTNYINKRYMEMEADAFAYYIINYSKKITSTSIISIICMTISIVLISASLLIHISQKKNYPDNLVYITATGTKFHTNKTSCAAITKVEAEKLFSPCNVCNPQ